MTQHDNTRSLFYHKVESLVILFIYILVHHDAQSDNIL